jgi:hypothetical protein
MGRGFRVFFVDNNDNLLKVSFARWERLNNRHPTECFPEFAGKRLRYIMVVLDLEEKKPFYISYIDCGYVTFDAAGKVDQEEWERHLQLAANSFDPFGPEANEGNVINAQTRFFRRSYDHKYRWNFSDGMLERLIKAIFG